MLLSADLLQVYFSAELHDQDTDTSGSAIFFSQKRSGRLYVIFFSFSVRANLFHPHQHDERLFS
jgi:hypothetical protein